MGITLDELAEKARRGDEKSKERLRRNYRLARKLGFSTTESRILSPRSQDTIYRLAEEKGRQPPKGVK